MSMSANQQAAFEGANSGNTVFSAGDLSFLIAGILATVILLWFVWVCISAYKGFSSGHVRIDIQDVGSLFVRALFVLVVTLAIISF